MRIEGDTVILEVVKDGAEALGHKDCSVVLGDEEVALRPLSDEAKFSYITKWKREDWEWRNGKWVKVAEMKNIDLFKHLRDLAFWNDMNVIVFPYQF